MPTDRATDRLLRLVRMRRLVRAPIAVYRAGLGLLFGPRLLMLEHVGRRTGARRFVVLEVIGRPGPGRYVVVAALGEGTQWWQNALAHPQVHVSTGFLRRRPALARPLPPAEVAEHLERYAREHPHAWPRFEPMIRRTAGGLPPDTPLAPHVRLLELWLTGQR